MKRTVFRRAVAVLLCLCTLASVVASMPLSVFANTDIDSYAPAGTVNVAVGSTITLSKCTNQRAGAENSYEMPQETWAKAFLTDESLSNGWSTDPYDRESDTTKPVTITLALPVASDISAVALFPKGTFPAEYTVSVSADGETYQKVADGVSSVQKPTQPAVHTFSTVRAAYVQIHVTKRFPAASGDGALVQLGEIAVYGNPMSYLKLDRTVLELTVGETDTLKPTGQGDATVTYASSDSSVVSVDSQGNLVAKKLGKATLTASANGTSATCTVSVVESLPDYSDNILLSIFWPPTPDYINDEQYQLMADAGINWVMGNGEETLRDPAIQQKMLALCAKYGMGMTVSDGNFGSTLLDKTEEEIAACVNAYKNVPGAYGFYIKDEPYNPNQFVDAYLALKSVNPDAYMHMNFLPYYAYGSLEKYYNQLYDWCALCAEGGYPVDYLIFDLYPFPLSGEMNREAFMTNLRVCHDVGLACDVKTGTYIQTVSQTAAFRTPSDSELRYEMYLSLAFGYKQLSFFTWFTPVNRAEPFANGIVSATGVPNAHYETIKTLNHEILEIGEILAKCDAMEIYLNGQTWGQPSIPKDFFVQPKDNKNYTLSLMKHKETGRNYLMVVNNNYNSQQSLSLTFDASVTSLSEVSRTDGSLKSLSMEGQSLNLTLAAGDAMLIALPDGLDFTQAPVTNPDPTTNLATLDGATVTASSSLGESGYYINTLIDGKRFSDSVSTGWTSEAGEVAYAIVDLGAVRDVNRVDLYPAGGIFDYGETFPQAFKISVSTDGINYTTVATVNNFTVENEGKTLTFDTQKAQYVRILAVGNNPVALAEIEIYNDDGTLPAMSSFSDWQKETAEVITYTDGKNLALSRPVYFSSAVESSYEVWGWSYKFVNDGNPDTGWTSNVKRNPSPDATEYIIIDLGDLFAVDSVVITPRGSFPEDYTLALSADGKTWTTVKDVKGSANLTEKFEVALSQAVDARFVRFRGTKLRGGGADGYLLQVGEIEAYGAPVCDKSVLEDAMTAYVEADGDTANQAYVDAQAGMTNALLTQSQANALAKALLKLAGIPEEDEPLPPVEDETGAPTEDETNAPAEDETNAPAEDETNAPTEDETNSPTEDETNAPAEDETNAPAEDETNAPVEDETNAPAEGETNASADTTTGEPSTDETTAQESASDTSVEPDDGLSSGCGSVIGTGSAAVLTAIAAAFVLRKKKES